MNRTSIAFVLALGALLLPARAAGADDAADAEKRFRDAFKPIKFPAAAKVEKDVTPDLPGGIVTEAGPFEAVIRKVVGPYDAQLARREDAMAALGALADPVTALTAATAAMDAENADLATRVAGVESMYDEVWDAGYMESGEKQHRARKLAAVLIPAYRTIAARNVAIAARAPEALAKSGGAARVAQLVAVATSGASSGLRGAAVTALGRIGGPEALAALTKVRATDASSSVRTKALASLCSFKVVEMKDAAIGALSDDAWEVRALAAAICAKARLVEAASVLVARMAKEDGRLRTDFDDALFTLVGVRFYGDPDLATKWWAENQAVVADHAKALAAAGEYEKVLGPVESWDPTGTAPGASAEGGDKAKGVTSSFYGITTSSKRILFVVDISFSMADPSGAKPAATTGVAKDAYPAPTGAAKIDIAKWQLHRAVASLPKDVAFDFVVFSESYKLWQEQMVEASDKTKAKAHDFIDSIKPNGTTNICDSVDKAFELAAPAQVSGKPKTGAPDLRADTVYLMTDGNPNRGRTSDAASLIDSVVTRNRTARLVFHTIGIGEAAGSELLQTVSKRTGGQYVGFK
ncbi:MAG: HEAT repeat domain-containing protein [Planctomycetes bacterium]|nr:HEAT repeat domain-containing protein [Planctomycetota bacterium]